MNSYATQGERNSSYQLRFNGLFKAGRGYAFPCDSEGHVDLDQLNESARLNYFYARAMVGREFSAPYTQPA